MNQGNCKHSHEERCVFGKRVLDEFRKAIDICYNLVKVFEYWEYKLTYFGKGTNSGGLFAEYQYVTEIEARIIRLLILGSE